MKWITVEQSEAIMANPHFGKTQPESFDLNENLNFYMFHFVEPLVPHIDSGAIRTIADIGTGYGWLAIAFALRTRCTVFAVDPNGPRLAAARAIADIMGVADRICWCVGSAAALPFHDRSIDATYCVEVIEHTRKNPNVLRGLAQVTRDFLVLTSPNRLFPLIAHDTKLPFCHWLPLSIRNIYASLFGRIKLQEGNLFWSPGEMFSILTEFERESSFFEFRNYDEYLRATSQIADGRARKKSVFIKLRDGYYKIASLAGRNAIYILPNLASTFRRRERAIS